MGFLDNSGDIILDVVLTDHGRKILAKGDGSFQITKFALGDEEVDYSLYNKNHASGSSYYDLEILQTPILEAFTDNAASMKTILQTYTNLELLFLPVLRLNERISINQRASNGVFYVCANRETEDNDGSSTTTTGVGRNSDGVINQGFLFGESLVGTIIKIDEGLDTTEISPKRKLDAELKETSYTVQIDNRLGKLVDVQGQLATPDYIDDDNIAYYTVDLGDTFVSDITDDTTSPSQIIQGPRGTEIQFRIQSSMDLNTSSYLFTTLGAETSLLNRSSVAAYSTCYYIDSNVRITGIKTGAMIDVPLRYIRLA
tara:strand:+ start:1468 stop:2409 length:942 start_codon:yes stop_codon:yes gene_type:complete